MVNERLYSNRFHHIHDGMVCYSVRKVRKSEYKSFLWFIYFEGAVLRCFISEISQILQKLCIIFFPVLVMFLNTPIMGLHFLALSSAISTLLAVHISLCKSPNLFIELVDYKRAFGRGGGRIDAPSPTYQHSTLYHYYVIFCQEARLLYSSFPMEGIT